MEQTSLANGSFPPFNLQTVSLNVLNPRAKLEPPTQRRPSQRIVDTENSTIAVYWNSKLGADHFLDALAAGMRRRLPSSQVVRLDGILDPGDNGAAALAEKADAFVYGVGD